MAPPSQTPASVVDVEPVEQSLEAIISQADRLAARRAKQAQILVFAEFLKGLRATIAEFKHCKHRQPDLFSELVEKLDAGAANLKCMEQKNRAAVLMTSTDEKIVIVDLQNSIAQHVEQMRDQVSDEPDTVYEMSRQMGLQAMEGTRYLSGVVADGASKAWVDLKDFGNLAVESITENTQSMMQSARGASNMGPFSKFFTMKT